MGGAVGRLTRTCRGPKVSQWKSISTEICGINTRLSRQCHSSSSCNLPETGKTFTIKYQMIWFDTFRRKKRSINNNSSSYYLKFVCPNKVFYIIRQIQLEFRNLNIFTWILNFKQNTYFYYMATWGQAFSSKVYLHLLLTGKASSSTPWIHN